ncbi:methyltransferase [Candidatus Omnitrophota bacterium]
MVYEDFNNINIKNCIGVYPVRESTEITARPLPELKFKSALDVGCGTGFISIYLRKLGFDCEGADINRTAVECARQNAKINSVKITFYISDLFENVNKEYDLIIFNPPISHCRFGSFNRCLNVIKSILPVKNQFILRLYYSLFKGQRVLLLKRFLSQVKNYLINNGKVVVLLTPDELSLIKDTSYKIIGGDATMHVVLLNF